MRPAGQQKPGRQRQQQNWAMAKQKSLVLLPGWGRKETKKRRRREAWRLRRASEKP